MRSVDLTVPRWRQRLAAALLVAAALPLAAGAVPKLKPLKAALAEPGRALLVLVVDAHFAVGTVTLADEAGKPAFVLKVDAAAGEYAVRLYSVPLGSLRVSALTLPDVRRKAFEVTDAKPFVLHADKVNYLGDLDVYNDDGLRFELRDHSGRLLTNLRESMPPLLTVAPLEFVGGDDDGWAGSVSGKDR